MRLIRSVFHPRIYRDPVDFPSPASIFRERLLKAARIRADVRYDKSNEDGSVVQCFLVEKLAASILKVADCGPA